MNCSICWKRLPPPPSVAEDSESCPWSTDVDTVEKTGDSVFIGTKTLTPPIIPNNSTNAFVDFSKFLGNIR
jgi:hypothetical protein